MPFIPETVLYLLELGLVIMLDSAAVLSVKPLAGLNIFIVLVFFKNLKLVRNRYFKKVDECYLLIPFCTFEYYNLHILSYLANLY